MFEILRRGSELSLSGTVRFHVGWDTLDTEGAVGVLLVDDHDKVPDNRYFVFINNPQAPDESVRLLGDGVDRDETVEVRLPDIPGNIRRIILVASAAGADEYAMINRVFAHLIAEETEVARYQPTEDVLAGTVMVLGELYRDGSEWRFRAEGEVRSTTLGETARGFGVRL